MPDIASSTQCILNRYYYLILPLIYKLGDNYLTFLIIDKNEACKDKEKKRYRKENKSFEIRDM